MKAGTGGAFSLSVSFALIAVAFTSGTGAATPPPSPTDANLFLHYNGNNQTAWMNADPADTESASVSIRSGGWAGGFWKYLNFSLRPQLENTNCLVLDASQDWHAHLHMSAKGVRFNASMTAGNITQDLNNWTTEGDIWTCRPAMGLRSLTPRDSLCFTLAVYIAMQDMPPPPTLTLHFDGTSYLALPTVGLDSDSDGDGLVNSLDPDDDNDGRNDTADAYPTDPARWEKPKPAKGFLPGFDMRPLVVAVAIVATVVRLTRRKVEAP